VLYQDIVLEPAMAHTLSLILYYANFNATFATPDSLDFTVDPNQQYRIDLLKPAADPFSVASSDVLATLFRTNPGDPLTLAPTTKTFDLTPYAGQTVRLRFAEVDNRSFLLASVDNVRITSVTPGGNGGNPGATPELSSIALFGSGFLGLAGFAVARARRRRLA
jgi:hypothetical protein